MNRWVCQKDWKVIEKVKKMKKIYGSGGIRTHASEETGALNQRLRPLGHATLQRLTLIAQHSTLSHATVVLELHGHATLQHFHLKHFHPQPNTVRVQPVFLYQQCLNHICRDYEIVLFLN